MALEDAAEAEETLGYQVRTTNCLQGKIDELVALCGEAERLSLITAEMGPFVASGRALVDAINSLLGELRLYDDRPV